MLLVTSNKSKKLLQIRFIGQIEPEDFPPALQDLKAQLRILPPGFRYMADFSQFETMPIKCSENIGQFMDLIGRAGVSQVVRIMPEPIKDFGLNILAAFHFPPTVQINIFRNLAEAKELLNVSEKKRRQSKRGNRA
jgi:hypothetical protein